MWQCRCGTDSPASGPLLMTRRKPLFVRPALSAISGPKQQGSHSLFIQLGFDALKIVRNDLQHQKDVPVCLILILDEVVNILRVGRPEDADEITNEVFLRSWEYMTAQQVENVTALFFRIARNLIADHYRKSGRTVPLTPIMEDNLAAPGSIEHDAQVKEEMSDLVEIMKGLKDEYREVLELRYQDEMSIDEIAELLGKTPNAVRVLLHRAKQALKKKV